MKMHENRMRIVVKTNMKFHRFLSNVSLANTEIIAVHYKSWRHILDSPASGYPDAYKLISIHHSVRYVKIFLHRLISEVSIYLYILSQSRKEDIRTGAQRHRAKKKKE